MKKLLFLGSLLLILAACRKEVGIKFEDLPAGDIARGETLFSQNVNDAPPCSSCHSLGDNALNGPGLEGYGERAGEREDNQSAEEYTFHSIVSPSKHVVQGFSNVMYNEYAEKLTAQQIADLSAFLLQQ